METSRRLSVESFSYSWLVNLDSSDEASFIEMDPRMPPTKISFRNSQDLKFDFPISQSPVTIVHADELFSNGYVMPIYVNPLRPETCQVSASSQAPEVMISARNTRCSSLRRCRNLSKHMFQKYFDFLRPLYRRIRGHRPSSRAEKIDTKLQSMKRWIYPADNSPRISVAYSADEWRRSCDSESSIHEAVLHCKKSIGK